MSIEQLLEKLDITDYPEIINNKITIFLRDSNVYMRVYEKLEKLDDEFEDGDIELTDEISNITYTNDSLYIKLSANYNENLYTLEIVQK